MPKGIDRLKELQHPRVCWIRKNWFPLTASSKMLAASSRRITSPAVLTQRTRSISSVNNQGYEI